MQGVYVICIDRQYLRIVVNSIVILAKFSETICSIVQSFDVIYGTVLHLICIVLDSVLEALHFAID